MVPIAVSMSAVTVAMASVTMAAMTSMTITAVTVVAMTMTAVAMTSMSVASVSMTSECGRCHRRDKTKVFKHRLLSRVIIKEMRTVPQGGPFQISICDEVTIV